MADNDGLIQRTSCTNCAKAKSKCVRSAAKDDCGRCERLQKICIARQPIRRKRNDLRRSRTAQLKQLETRLEDIARSLGAKEGLQSRTQHAYGADPGIQTEQTVSVFPATIPSNGLLQSTPAFAELEVADQNIQWEQTVHQAPLNVSEKQDERLLNRYVRLMADGLPFVLIPPTTTASYLATTKPALMQAIRTVTFFHDTDRQQLLAKDLMRLISEKMLINGEKSMDLLQALLVFSNWLNPHLYQNISHSTIFQLAVALATNLHIDRPVDTCEKVMIEAALKAHGVPQPAKTINNDERRALLGLYYLMSKIYTSFRKIDTPAWTPWLAESLQDLVKADEFDSDKHIVKLVQMQHIMHDAMSTKYDHAPVQFYAKSFLSDLENIAIGDNGDMVSKMLRLQYACTRTSIWERSFMDLTAEDFRETDLRHRLNGMWRCMEAAKAYIEVYMTLSIQEYALVPFGLFAQYAYIFVVIIRATSIEMEGWDVDALRDYIDFSGIMEEASSRYEAVDGKCIDGENVKNDAFAKWAAKTRWAKAYYDTKFVCAQASTRSFHATRMVDSQCDDTSNHAPRYDGISSMPGFDHFDDISPAFDFGDMERLWDAA